MKILAKFLLFSAFAFLLATGAEPLYAQTWSQYENLQSKVFELEMKIQDQQKDIQGLEIRCQTLEKALKDTKWDSEFLPTMTDLDSVERSLDQVKSRLTAAEVAIEELNRKPTSGFIPDSPSISPASKPKVPRNKTMVPANKSTPAVKEGTQ